MTTNKSMQPNSIHFVLNTTQPQHCAQAGPQFAPRRAQHLGCLRLEHRPKSSLTCTHADGNIAYVKELQHKRPGAALPAAHGQLAVRQCVKLPLQRCHLSVRGRADFHAEITYCALFHPSYCSSRAAQPTPRHPRQAALISVVFPGIEQPRGPASPHSPWMRWLRAVFPIPALSKAFSFG